jgi:very-short-patch-repair endonuclease
MKVHYKPHLKEFARQLRNNSTKSEIKLWSYLKRKQMGGYDFHRQKPIDNYIADFYCNKLNLVIELDGLTHQWEETFEKDKLKQKRLEELGFKVLRFSDDEVINDIDNVLRVIRFYIEDYQEKTGHTPGPSL